MIAELKVLDSREMLISGMLSREVLGKFFKTNLGGFCEVIEYNNYDDIVIRFLDKSAHEVKTGVSQLKCGVVKNPYYPKIYGVGYIGVGVHKSREGGVLNKTYNTWAGMLGRVYCEKSQLLNPSYIGCSVVEHWHNFQNFAEWYESQKFYGVGYHLDKDILFEGNKIYSPETCCLVPRKINNLLVSKFSKNSGEPQGVCFDTSRGKYLFQISLGDKGKLSKRFDSSEEAETAYKEAKESQVKDVALEWKGRIEDKVFYRLMNWELV